MYNKKKANENLIRRDHAYTHVCLRFQMISASLVAALFEIHYHLFQWQQFSEKAEKQTEKPHFTVVER